MANFIAIYDPNQERRKQFEDICRKKIAIFPDLEKGEIHNKNFSIHWAANPNAPLDTYQDNNQISIIFGDAIQEKSDIRMTAKSLTEKWSTTQDAQNEYYDGYYCAIKYDSEKGLIIGGDILGLFPVYYYSHNDIILVASSPELFRFHESFNPELSLKGLTGILLTMHSIEGLTLWNDVIRLREGHILDYKLHGKPQEKEQYQLPLSQKYYDLPFSHQVELIHDRMEQAVKRHAPPNNPYSFLFSGGLDSRMLAGYLKERGEDITAITFGKSSDMEMKIAKKAMKVLPFRHKCINKTFENYDLYANLTAQWEHGLQGFNTIQSWGHKQALEKQNGGKVITGIHHDGVFHTNYGKDLRIDDDSNDAFRKVLNNVTRWGLSTKELADLLKFKNSNSIIDSTIDQLKKRFESYSNSNYEKTWCFELFHRGRFHHGGSIWKMSFGAWPVIPIVDRKVLDVMAGIPFAAKSRRRAQQTLVSTYFPDLAKIVLDGNNNDPQPLIPTWQFLLLQKLNNQKLIKRLTKAFKSQFYGPWHTNLYYHRIFDIDNDGWKAIRKQAEKGRPVTKDLFNQSELCHLVPPSEENIDKRLWEVSGIKTVIGFFLWLQLHER